MNRSCARPVGWGLLSLLIGCSTEPTFVGPGSASSSSTGGASSSSGIGAGGAGGIAGASGGGTGGSGGAPGCPGSTHLGHCYVDLTAGTSTWPAAVDACTQFGVDSGTPAHLVVIDNLDEDDFVVFTFLQATQRTQDAWISLTCDATAHPDVADCFCAAPCTDTVLLDAKRANWSWTDGSPNGYQSWGALNPNGDGRCAALTYVSNAWSWADRDCDAGVFTTDMGVMRSYRTICEIEP